jgi:hypothetical protein
MAAAPNELFDDGYIPPGHTGWVESAVPPRGVSWLEFPSDDADVDPVPPGTPVGNVAEMALVYGAIGPVFSKWSRDPAALDAIMTGCDPDGLNARIKERARRLLAS